MVRGPAAARAQEPAVHVVRSPEGERRHPYDTCRGLRWTLHLCLEELVVDSWRPSDSCDLSRSELLVINMNHSGLLDTI